MFPKVITDRIDADIVPFNPLIANGLATVYMDYGEEYVHRIFELTARHFPPGLTYDGRKRCTPLKEYDETTKKRGPRSSFDVARSDVFLMEYMFSYKGHKLNSRFMYLPFVSKAGTIYLSGSRFVISPTLADRVISVGMNSVFVRLNKARLTFNRLDHFYLACVDGNWQRETVPVAWGDIYNKRPGTVGVKPTIRAKHSLVHYLFCKYGVSEVFQRFAGVSPVIGGEEINEDTYPSTDWVICTTTGLKPYTYGKAYHEPPKVRLAFPKNTYSPMVKNLVAGFYYVADHFPSRVTAQFVNHTSLWMILLGQLIWSGDVSHGKLEGDVKDHIASLDEYVDQIVHEKLRAIGYDCEDFYVLLALVIKRFHEWTLTSEDRVSTMYDKELAILPFVYYEIVSAINNLYFKLKAASKKELVTRKIESIMQKNLKTGLIFKITKEYGGCTTTSTSGDNMALKLTNLLTPQSSSSKNNSRKDRMAIDDPSKRLHASIAEVGQVFSLPKSEPSGRSRVALTLLIDESGMVKRRPQYQPMLDGVQELIRRR